MLPSCRVSRLRCRCLPPIVVAGAVPLRHLRVPSPADILLSWDYWELERKMSAGGGPISELPTIPQHFTSVEVGLVPTVTRRERRAPVLPLRCCPVQNVLQLLRAASHAEYASPMSTTKVCVAADSHTLLLQEYVRVFEPLLLEECAAQMLRGQEEGQVLSAQPAVVAAVKARAEDESLLVRLTLPADAAGGMHENDMLLVSRDNPEASGAGAADRGSVRAPAASCWEREEGGGETAGCWNSRPSCHPWCLAVFHAEASCSRIHWGAGRSPPPQRPCSPTAARRPCCRTRRATRRTTP